MLATTVRISLLCFVLVALVVKMTTCLSLDDPCCSILISRSFEAISFLVFTMQNQLLLLETAKKSSPPQEDLSTPQSCVQDDNKAG